MSGNREEILRAARDAIDTGQLLEVVELAYGRDANEEVAEALAEAAAEEIALATLEAGDLARRRVRPPQAEDVARSVEHRRQCCCGDGAPPMEPLFGVWESE